MTVFLFVKNRHRVSGWGWCLFPPLRPFCIADLFVGRFHHLQGSESTIKTLNSSKDSPSLCAGNVGFHAHISFSSDKLPADISWLWNKQLALTYKVEHYHHHQYPVTSCQRMRDDLFKSWRWNHKVYFVQFLSLKIKKCPFCTSKPTTCSHPLKESLWWMGVFVEKPLWPTENE